MRHLTLLLTIIAMLVMADAGASSNDFTLHQAVLDDDIQRVRKLLSKGAAIDVIGSRKYGYGSALHLAVREDHLDIAKLLLERGAQVDVLDPDDFTPLHNAAWNGNLEMTELLLAAGADIEASTYDGDTPLTLAQNNDQAQVATFIQAKLQPAVSGDTQIESTAASDSTVIDITGTYVSSVLTKYGHAVGGPQHSKITLLLEQHGDTITGTDSSGKADVRGTRTGDTIKIEFWAPFWSYGAEVVWKVNADGTQLEGSWKDKHDGYGEWNLTKVESDAAPIPDISGTYIAETTFSGRGPSGDTRKSVKNMNGKLIVLKQTGNTITGSVSSQSNWIKGTREGNIINFYIIEGNEIIGSWEINADATNLEGKWFTNGAGGASGKWNLTKIDADD
jgi:hypothetical protein